MTWKRLFPVLLDLVAAIALVTTWSTQEVGRIPTETSALILTVLPMVLITIGVTIASAPAMAVVVVQLVLLVAILVALASPATPPLPGAWTLVAGLGYMALRTGARRRDGPSQRIAAPVMAVVILLITNAALVGLHTDRAENGILFAVVVFSVGALSHGWRTVRALQRRNREIEGEFEVADRELRVLTEKNEIARDVHDVMAHSLAVVLMQADGARAVVMTDAKRAAQALDEIASTARSSLVELRLLLESLHSGSRDGAFPGLADLETLAERFRNAGMAVEMNLDAPGGDLTAEAELSVYRIVQESLTNALRYSGPPPNARVRVLHAPESLSIEIVSTGVSAASDTGGSGHGIAGMRERAALVGGVLIAERTTAGFRVHATLPLATDGALP